ncbi:MAG: hypothetical protein IPP21_06480 [Betaproteobacteria bacterium]|nr:hypothetical protein [Betaproteobacteria bacterium]
MKFFLQAPHRAGDSYIANLGTSEGGVENTRLIGLKSPAPTVGQRGPEAIAVNTKALRHDFGN